MNDKKVFSWKVFLKSWRSVPYHQSFKSSISLIALLGLFKAPSKKLRIFFIRLRSLPLGRRVQRIGDRLKLLPQADISTADCARRLDSRPCCHGGCRPEHHENTRHNTLKFQTMLHTKIPDDAPQFNSICSSSFLSIKSFHSPLFLRSICVHKDRYSNFKQDWMTYYGTRVLVEHGHFSPMSTHIEQQ